MNTLLVAVLAVAVVGILNAQNTSAQPQDVWRSLEPSRAAGARAMTNRSGFAEKIYEKFTEFSDRKVVFAVKPIAEGGMQELKNIRLSDITGKPTVIFENGLSQKAIVAPRLLPSSARITNNPDDAQTGQGLEDAGFPMAEGRYRVFSIRANVDGSDVSYHSVEMCWQSKNWCFVYDPIFNVTSRVFQVARSRKGDPAKGSATLLSVEPSAFPTCVMKNSGKTGVDYITNGFTKTVYDLFSPNKEIGKISVGYTSLNARCHLITTRVCNPEATSIGGTSLPPYAATSIGRMQSGYKAACDKIAKFGVSGTSFAMLARTGCAYTDSVNPVALDYTLTGSGSSTNSTRYARGFGVVEKNHRYADTCIIK
ncbi:MAG: hypothetical protein V4673_18525 [Pseudomonadota bacterium]